MCLHEYFQENCRYASDCFRRLKYTYQATSHPNIMTPRPIQQKGPTFLGNCCLFSHFDTFFTFTSLNINIQSTLVDQNFGKCFSCPKGDSVQISSHLDTQIQKNSISKVVVPRSPFSNKYVQILVFFNFENKILVFQLAKK